MRKVSRLRSAERLDSWPAIIPRSQARGVKALGRRYEVAVGRQLGSGAKRGVWWSYQDANGPGLCQTDFLVEGDAWVVVLECKHTWTQEGMEQLGDLYLPVVRLALDKRVVGVQVCKHLVPNHSGPVYNDLESAVTSARQGAQFNGVLFESPRLVTLHWRGFGSLLNQKELAYG